MMDVRVRMAPSPTGNLHLGTAYTTLFNYLFAKKNKGTFVLRLEDTDKERSKNKFEQNILEGLKWLGLNWDEGPFRQSERLKNYQEAAQKLINEDKAYYCFCSEEELTKEREDTKVLGLPQIYSGKCRKLTIEEVEENFKLGKKAAIRFKMPEDRGQIIFEDLLHGNLSFDSKLLGDMVIVRSNGMPLYNFTVVVDDIDMKITHVLRGEDHLSNTPKQIVLFEALNVAIPKFAHWPLILNSDRIGKLSKRNNATSIDDYRKLGYLAEAIINYFALLGWTMPDNERSSSTNREIMSLKEMEQSFDLSKMRLSAAAFNLDKLDWLNGEYIRKMSDEELTKRLEDFLVDHPAKGKLSEIVPLIKERIKKLSDFIPLCNFLFQKPEYDLEIFNRLKIQDLRLKIEKIIESMEKMKTPREKEEFEKTFRDLANELKILPGDCFQLIRVAISGQLVTPPLFESIQILGEEETINRVKAAVKFIAG